MVGGCAEGLRDGRSGCFTFRGKQSYAPGMRKTSRAFWAKRPNSLVSCVLLTWSLITGQAAAQENAKFKEFSKPVIDIGIAAQDVEKSAKFYTEAIGFTEVQGFHVSGELGRQIVKRFDGGPRGPNDLPGKDRLVQRRGLRLRLDAQLVPQNLAAGLVLRQRRAALSEMSQTRHYRLMRTLH